MIWLRYLQCRRFCSYSIYVPIKFTYKCSCCCYKRNTFPCWHRANPCLFVIVTFCKQFAGQRTMDIQSLFWFCWCVFLSCNLENEQRHTVSLSSSNLLNVDVCVVNISIFKCPFYSFFFHNPFSFGHICSLIRPIKYPRV